ncbi:MAG: hypothetical protein HDT22_10500 [Ruminococcus sp.]|nr:hypothetical protein [Ruminococcus sp.]
MFSILIKDQKNGSMYRFLTVKQEVFKEESKEMTDPETQEVKTEIIQIPTGETETVVYSTDNRDDLEKKCIELLRSYKVTDFIPIDTLEYDTDLIWKTDKE